MWPSVCSYRIHSEGIVVLVAVTIISHSSPLRFRQLSVGENRLATLLHRGQVEKDCGDPVVPC
jgi:hypothetical protein